MVYRRLAIQKSPFVLFLIVGAFVFLAVLLISNSREAARKKKELWNERQREQEERRAENQKWKRQAWDEACSMTDHHLPALARKFSQTTYIDDYGNQIRTGGRLKSSTSSKT